MPTNPESVASLHRFYKTLYFRVIIGIILGVLLGAFYPNLGEQMKPLGDGFIKLIKMIIAPIIFLTVVVGSYGRRFYYACGDFDKYRNNSRRRNRIASRSGQIYVGNALDH